MGTNYYHVTDACPTCGHGETRHIGKSCTMFQAVIDWDDEGDAVITIGSWRQWKARILSSGVVRDEYGDTHTAAEFVAMVESTSKDARGRQVAWMQENMPYRVSDGPRLDSDWLDSEGFSFTTSEFS